MRAQARLYQSDIDLAGLHVVPIDSAVAAIFDRLRLDKKLKRIGRPYLMRYAAGGALDAGAIARAKSGSGGVLAQIFVRMFKGFRPEETVNPLLDTNNDGKISFAEADPIIASWYADTLDSGLGMSASGRALPGVAASV